MNKKAHNPLEKQYYDWKGDELVPRETTHIDVRDAINAHRGQSVFGPVHIPLERTCLPQS